MGARIGERTRDAMRHKRAKQERFGNIAYGYRLAEDGKHVELQLGGWSISRES